MRRLLALCATFTAWTALGQTIDLVGDWRWTCCDNKHSGVWHITTQGLDGKFAGKFSGQAPDDVGTLEGSLAGNQMEFVRKGSIEGEPFEQHWTGAIKGDRIVGSLEYGGFTAERMPPDLRGTWRWICCGGVHAGTWEIARQEADGTFAGKFGGTSADDVGTIEGKIEGKRVQFVRRGAVEGITFEQKWLGTITGKAIRGKLEFGSFSADFVRATTRTIRELPGGGICFDPQTLTLMDEWLKEASPPQRPGESLRYEPWGRVVGMSRTGEIAAPPRPETPLSRCDWLWYHSTRLRSTNLGTLREYVDKRRE